MSETASDQLTPALLPFAFEGKEVRVVTIGGEPHFAGRDVADRLGYADATNAMKQHCRGVVKHHPIVDALGREQKARVLTEPDVLRLIISSNLPAAERFERFVFEEVLPTIRKTGSYSAPSTSHFLRAPAAEKTLDSFVNMAKRFGLDEPTALLAASRATQAEVGLNPMQALGITHIEAAKQRAIVTPTQIAQRMGLKSAQVANKLLQDRGYQTKEADGEWKPTKKGEAFSHWDLTGKSRSDGTTIAQLRWFEDVVDALQTEAA
ncbi:BRO-N domain-containing protein [Roseomonas chloroacetimidivorans]|uniref:BRO-N domain-containing protein n=1 Tax=Roseomonas chloroacetimidivorans TaxID=1766656 RepID=UPI003C749042